MKPIFYAISAILCFIFTGVAITSFIYTPDYIEKLFFAIGFFVAGIGSSYAIFDCQGIFP